MAAVSGLRRRCACSLGAFRSSSPAAGARRSRPRAAPKIAKPTCPDPAAWQKLANRVGVPVYCPGWLPDPLTGKLGAVDNNIHSVSADRSYLQSWVWQETGGGAAGGELHVNLRAYPGRDEDPDVPHRRLRQPQRAVLRLARRPHLGERDQLGRSTRSTRTPTRGTTWCSGAGTATSTRSPSTSRRRSPASTCGST